MSGRTTQRWREDTNLTPVSELLVKLENEKDDLTARYHHDEPIEENVLDVPDTWTMVRLSKVAKNIQYGYTESAKEDPIGPKFLRISDIQEGAVHWEDAPYCEIDDDEKKKYLLQEGDLLFTRTGGTVGKSYMIEGDIPEAVFASYLIRIQLKEKVCPEFVYAFFQSDYYWHQVHEGKVGIGQPNVNATKLSELVLPLPPLEEQRKIVNEIDRVLSVGEKVDRTLKNELQRAQRLRQAILKQAFEGELISLDLTNKSTSENHESRDGMSEQASQMTLSEVTSNVK